MERDALGQVRQLTLAQVVEHVHDRASAGQRIDDVRADETGAAGDENIALHDCPPITGSARPSGSATTVSCIPCPSFDVNAIYATARNSTPVITRTERAPAEASS